MARVLVVGAAGFMGQHVCAALREHADIVGLDLAPPRPDLGHVDWITGSIGDQSLVASAADGCGAVVFLANASLPASSQVRLAREAASHVTATLEVAETCEALGVERFVFASSGGTVYGADAPNGGLTEDGPTRPRNGYGVSKLAVEHYLRLMSERGRMRTLSLRIANPYGEGQRALRGQGIVAAAMEHAREGTVLPIWGDGSVERDFVHISDVARAFSAALSHDGPSTVLNVGSGRGVTINDLLERIRSATGRELRVEYRSGRPIDVHRNALAVGRAREEMGWEATTGLDDGLARTARWWGMGSRKPLATP